jgi:pyruvate kinase
MKKANLSMYDHLLMYTPNSKRKPYRSTQIVAALNPNVTKEEVVKMIEAGMNIASFEVGKDKTEKTIEPTLKLLKEAVVEYNEIRCKEAEKQAKMGGKVIPGECLSVHVATALDIKGSSVETGIFAAACQLTDGQEVNLTNDAQQEAASNDQCIYVNYPDLTSLLPAQVIIINGVIKLELARIDDAGDFVTCTIIKGGELKDGEAFEVSIPGVKVEMSGAADDVSKLAAFCKKNDIDMIFTPINNPSAFKKMKCLANADDSSQVLKVIAKLEGQEAVLNVDKIIEQADGVMVSRGRLGRSLQSPEQVIIYQKNILAKCIKAGIPSIVANDILKSMQGDGEATRAEMADIVNAVLDGADCTMLDENVSTESAIETMRNIIMEAEDMVNHRSLFRELLNQVSIPPSPITTYNFTDVIAISACTAAMVNAASAIVVLTETGKSVQMISKYRPECPIIAVTRSPAVARQCLLSRGVFSIVFGGKCE